MGNFQQIQKVELSPGPVLLRCVDLHKKTLKKHLTMRCKMCKLKLILAALVLMVVLGSVAIPAAHAGWWSWSTAYQVAFTHWDPWYEPHYGAYFSGCYGRNQYFTGPSGAPADYGSWNWWGNCYGVLLLSKTWLFMPACWGICADRWDGNHHHAYLFFN